MGDFFKSEEEKKELQRIEQIKKLGRSFIRVRYTGGGQYPRIHGAFGVRAFQHADSNGKTEWKTVEDSAPLEFVADSVGNLVADVLDSEYNRIWLSRHLPPGGEIEIDDPATRREIEALKGKPFKVEVPRVEQLRRDRERLDREIATEESMVEESTEVAPEEPAGEVPEPAQKSEESPPAQQPEQPKRRGRPPGSKNKPKAKRKQDSDRLNDKG